MRNKINVYKIGGAGLENWKRFKAFANAVTPSFQAEKNVVVCSAQKGVTRILISVFEAKKIGDEDLLKNALRAFYDVHFETIAGLSVQNSTMQESFENLFGELESAIMSGPVDQKLYASILQYGEIVSSMILSLYLTNIGLDNIFLDARNCIKTTGPLGNASIFSGSEKYIQAEVGKKFESSSLITTQGFIGKDANSNENSILSLDGSDISAAFFAYSLRARQMIFLKDVRGISVVDNPVTEEDFNNIHASLRFEEYATRFSRGGKAPVHLDAIEILSRRKISTRICSFFAPLEYGTEIN